MGDARKSDGRFCDIGRLDKSRSQYCLIGECFKSLYFESTYDQELPAEFAIARPRRNTVHSFLLSNLRKRCVERPRNERTDLVSAEEGFFSNGEPLRTSR